MKRRRQYPAFILFNGRIFNEVIIDPHYEENHPEMTDELIIEIVKSLNRKKRFPQELKDGWKYFELDSYGYQGRCYRLILCTQDQGSFIGVINCFRR